MAGQRVVLFTEGTCTGSRTPVFTTYVPSVIDDVADAAAASATNGDAVEPGWSATSNDANPAASERAASAVHDAASVNDA